MPPHAGKAGLQAPDALLLGKHVLDNIGTCSASERQGTLRGSCSCRVTLERVVEELRVLLKEEKVPEDLPAETGPAKYPYTNNSVADFVGLVSFKCVLKRSMQAMYTCGHDE